MSVNSVDQLDKDIEQMFYKSGGVEGYSILQQEFDKYSLERSEEIKGIWAILGNLRRLSGQNSIDCGNGVRDMCFTETDGLTVLTTVQNNRIAFYVSIELSQQEEQLTALSEHEIEFQVKDDEIQYANYPKSKQRIVHFVRNYRQGIFPALKEDLFTCDFAQLHLDGDVIIQGCIAGGSTGFLHFVAMSGEEGWTSFQVHGDVIFQVRSLSSPYKNIVLSAGKDGCLYISDIRRQVKLVQMKDFLSTSPMSQFISVDIDAASKHILSTCGDGTVQVWSISEQVNRTLLGLEEHDHYLSIETALYNHQVLAQEDIMHTTQPIQGVFYGKFIVFLTSQGYITFGTFIRPPSFSAAKELRKFDIDHSGKTLNFFQVASFDLGSKINSYDKIMFIDSRLGILWVGGHDSTIYCYDLKERQFEDIDYNYSKPLMNLELSLDEQIRKIHFNDSYTTLYVLTTKGHLYKFSFEQN